MRPLIPVLVLLTALVGGCISAGVDPVDPASAPASAGAFVPEIPEFDWTSVVDPDHANHQLPLLHTGGNGLTLAGRASIAEIVPPGVSAAITQVDVWQNYALVSGMQGGMAFAIVDITDPNAPRTVSWFPSAADGWTARFSDDGNYVFYGCQMFGAPYTPWTAVKGTCEDPDAVHTPLDANPAGVTVVDVSDKANPVFVDFLETGGSHNIFVAGINGTDYVFTSAVTILKFDRETKSLEQVAEVPGVHDATVARHPLTGDWLLFTGTGELSIYNVNDPTNPEPLFLGAEAPDMVNWVGWHEQTLVPGMVDGKAVLVVGGESFVSPQGIPDKVGFVDVTDPRNPTLLSEWAPPFTSATPWVSYLYSVHEIAATPTGQVAISWYHAGVWVLDVSTAERQAEPATLAAYLPNAMMDALPALFVQTPQPVVPFVWGAGWDARGYLIVPDMYTGLYVLEPDYGLRPAIDGGQ